MKKNFLYSFILVFSLFLIKTSNPATTPPPGFDEFMQNVDMDQILKDMEDIFGQIDEKETPGKKVTSIEPSKKAASTPKTKKNLEDKETTFKKPFEVKQGESEQIATKLPKEKREAFQFYMNDFLKKLDLIENKIDSFDLGIPFKEELEDLKLGGKKENYKNLINNIRIQYGRVKSKQLYQRGFYLEKHNEVRENIIKALKKLKTLEKEISQVKKSDDLFDTKSLKKQRGLKKDIKQFFTITLAPISEKLTLTTDTEDIKKEIESKKKKRERITQQAKRKQEREARTAKRRRPMGARRGRDRTSPWQTGGGRDFSSPWQRGRTRPRGYSPYREPAKLPKTDTKFKDTTRPDTGREKDDDKRFTAGAKDKKEITNIIGLKKQVAQILKENIIEPLKKNKNDLQSILTEKNDLSEMAQSLKLIKQYESKLSEQETKNMKNTEEYKKTDKFLNEQLKASIPYIITLCKFEPEHTLPTETKGIFAKEQKAALYIYQEVLNKDKQLSGQVQRELQTQEKTIADIVASFPKKKAAEIGKIEKIFTELIANIVAIETKVGTAKTQCETFENATKVKFRMTYNQPAPVKSFAQQAKTEIEKTEKTFDEIKKKIKDLIKIKNVKEFKTPIEEINNIQTKIQQIIKSCQDAKNDIKATLPIQNIIISTANDLMTNLEDIQKDTAAIPVKLDEGKQKYETLFNELVSLNATLNKEPKYKK